jgi:hypothetical protein
MPMKQILPIAVLTIALVGCRAEPDPALSTSLDNASAAHESSTDNTPAEASDDAAPAVAPYPKGRWRLGDWNDLQRVPLWSAHILIRHNRSSRGYVFSPTASVVEVAPERSRQEALRIAEEVAREARSAPDEFGRIARERSDDRRTAEQGGVLGVYIASQFLPWPMVLDAFAALKPGDVSAVVETQYGFHVFRRLPPPPEETLTGAHIVIAHNEVPALARLAGKQGWERSRDDARGLAESIFAAASADPSTFDALVTKHSDHPNAVRRGDLGTWSTREPSPQGPQNEVLRRLKVGGVAPPIDTPQGYQVIQRQANRARARYAVDAIQLPYDGTLPDEDPGSRQAVLQVARSLIQEIEARPERFRELQRKECCVEPLVWQDGRGISQLANAVDPLEIGEMVAAPIDAGFSFFVARRIEAPRASDPPPLPDLPAPTAPNLDFLAAYRDTVWVRELLAQVADKSRELIVGLPPSKRAAFMARHQEQTGLDEQAMPEERVGAFAAMQSDVASLLGSERYLRYRSILNEHFEQDIMRGQF